MEKLEEKVEKELPDFDPSSPPSNIQNRRAARAHGLRYDSRRKQYVGSGGNPVRDKFGQYL